MIFRSQFPVQPSSGAVSPAFAAIAEVQQRAAASDWFVTQPDHCRISGELAAALDPRLVPNLSGAVVRAIAMHDIGWMPFDGDAGAPRAPKALDSGVAVSFTNCEPETFLPAWMGSIQAAQSTGPLGGLIVSAHFARLTEPYLESGKGTPGQRAQVEQFRAREMARIERLLPQAGLPRNEVEALVEVLRFCDLASLYWCANPAPPVELPQEFRCDALREAACNGGRVQFHCERGSFRMTPKLLARALELEIPCVRFVNGKPELETAAVSVQ
jgi:Protein of unknown function (DUF3891)